MSKEDEDVCVALSSLLDDEGIDVLLNTRIKHVSGKMIHRGLNVLHFSPGAVGDLEEAVVDVSVMLAPQIWVALPTDIWVSGPDIYGQNTGQMPSETKK